MDDVGHSPFILLLMVVATWCIVGEKSMTDYRKKSRRQWAALIKKVYEVDPLVCTKCGGKMKVISFIQEPAIIEKILRHIGLWSPAPRSPPRTILPDLPVGTILDGGLPSGCDYPE